MITNLCKGVAWILHDVVVSFGEPLAAHGVQHTVQLVQAATDLAQADAAEEGSPVAPVQTCKRCLMM